MAYGSYYYLNDTFPTSGTSSDGFFDTTVAGALGAYKTEDIDTNPNHPNQVVLGIQDSASASLPYAGLYTFDFSLNFSGGNFATAGSSFSITKIQNQNDNIDGLFGDADNVDWTEATTLNGVSYPNGLIFVNEDSGTNNGETWMMTPTGSGLTRIADTSTDATATETSGILDISTLVGYKPGSILLTSNQGTNASLSVLINPSAALLGDFNGNGIVDAADYVVWRIGLGTTYTQNDYDIWRSQFGQTPGSAIGAAAEFFGSGSASVPEPSSATVCFLAIGFAFGRRGGRWFRRGA